MHKTSPLIAALAVATSLCATAASAAPLTAVSATLSNNTVSSPTSLTLKYTLATALDGSNNDILLVATFAGVQFGPNSCNGGITIAAGATDITQNMNICTASGSTVQLRLASGTIAANTPITVTIANASTVATPGPYQAVTFRTAMSQGGTIDEANPKPGYTLTAASPVNAVPTLSEWAMILFGTILAGGAALYVERRRHTV